MLVSMNAVPTAPGHGSSWHLDEPVPPHVADVGCKRESQRRIYYSNDNTHTVITIHLYSHVSAD